MKWFGTYGHGLSSFDGTSWNTSTIKNGLPDNTILDITFDTVGVMWIGTDKGASYFKEGKWETFNENNSGISSNHVFEITVDNTNTLWFGTYNGISSYDGNSWKVYSAKHSMIFSKTDASILSISMKTASCGVEPQRECGVMTEKSGGDTQLKTAACIMIFTSGQLLRYQRKKIDWSKKCVIIIYR